MGDNRWLYTWTQPGMQVFGLQLLFRLPSKAKVKFKQPTPIKALVPLRNAQTVHIAKLGSDATFYAMTA